MALDPVLYRLLQPLYEWRGYSGLNEVLLYLFKSP